LSIPSSVVSNPPRIPGLRPLSASWSGKTCQDALFSLLLGDAMPERCGIFGEATVRRALRRLSRREVVPVPPWQPSDRSAQERFAHDNTGTPVATIFVLGVESLDGSPAALWCAMDQNPPTIPCSGAPRLASPLPVGEAAFFPACSCAIIWTRAHLRVAVERTYTEITSGANWAKLLASSAGSGLPQPFSRSCSGHSSGNSAHSLGLQDRGAILLLIGQNADKICGTSRKSVIL
jgi:hypothetical protein